jgi:hypothetical protein
VKKIAVALLMLLVLPAHARERTQPVVTPAPHDPQLLASVRAHMRQGAPRAQMRGAGPGASAIVENRSSRVLVIPAAGNAPGSNATYFRSDVTIANLNDVAQNVVVLWLPNGDPGAIRNFKITIPPGPAFTYVDFVGQTLGLTGVGSLMILPVDATGNLDVNGALDAYSRIWSPAPNSGQGTFSQPFPAVDIFHLQDSRDAMMLGLRQDAGFRTNYGIVNLSDFALPYDVSVYNNAGALVSSFRVIVRSSEMILRALPAGDFGNISIRVNVGSGLPPGEMLWTTFASSTDNFTGDGWVSIGSLPLNDAALDVVEEP